MEKRIKEYHDIIRCSDPLAAFPDQLADVLDKIKDISEGRLVFFLRFFISDAANQVRLSDVETILKQTLAIEQVARLKVRG